MEMAMTTLIDNQENWTTDEEGRANSSEQFKYLSKEIARLIRSDAHMLINGKAELTAQLILAQLAHKHGFGPITNCELDEEKLALALQTIHGNTVPLPNNPTTHQYAALIKQWYGR